MVDTVFAGRRVGTPRTAAPAALLPFKIPVQVPGQEESCGADDHKNNYVLNHLIFLLLKAKQGTGLVDRCRQDKGEHGIKCHGKRPPFP